MKKQLSKKSISQSTLSLSVLLIFILMGIGSTSILDLLGIPLSIETNYYEDTEKFIETTSGTNWMQRITGKKDDYGHWKDAVEIENTSYYHDGNGLLIRKSFENVDLVDGKRNGQSITSYYAYYEEGKTLIDRKDTVCYDHGNVIPCSELKYASITAENTTGFQILKSSYPWFLISLNVLGYENEYVQSYMDTIEVLLNAESFDFTKFDSNYDDVIELLEETAYDSIIKTNAMVTSTYGMKLMKDLEFRMAVIDQQRDKTTTTFQFLQRSYPHFLTSFNTDDLVVEDSEWENFCSKFDSLMNTFSTLDIYDPFFVDSVDTRIFSTLMAISQEEPDTTKSAIIKSVLKQVRINMQNLSLSSLLKEHETPLLQQQTESITPQAFATGILIRMARKYLFEGDVPRLAMKEAYANQQGVVQVANVTTKLNAKITENNFELLGNVLNDGGAPVTERGLVWAKYANPTVDDNKIIVGEGIGGFTSSLQITDDSTYYVRAFAINSAGTAYGNYIVLNNSSLVGLDEFDSVNLKFLIYPNPASEITTLKLDNQTLDQIEVTIVNINGQVIFRNNFKNLSPGQNELKINVSGLENGIYYCRLVNSNTIIGNGKLLISR